MITARDLNRVFQVLGVAGYSILCGELEKIEGKWAMYVLLTTSPVIRIIRILQAVNVHAETQ